MKDGAGVSALTMRPLALLLGAMLVVATVFVGAGQAQAAKPGSGSGSLPVSGTLSDGGTFEGTVSNLSASVDKETGDLLVSGVLRGTATTADGTTQQVTQEFTTTAALSQGGSCQILFLDLGPIFLDLLGLQVDLSPITLDVTAVPGSGNLLGNLLCAVAGLLDNPGNTTGAIANLLDQIFSLLG